MLGWIEPVVIKDLPSLQQKKVNFEAWFEAVYLHVGQYNVKGFKIHKGLAHFNIYM